jgi:putative transcriptional regulator
MKDKSILEVVHDSAKDLHDAGLMDRQTMREFDALCLPPVKDYTPEQIQRIRKDACVSQTVFAAYLNTSPDTIRKWEARGQTRKRPNGAAMKLLNLVDQYGLNILGDPEQFKAGKA